MAKLNLLPLDQLMKIAPDMVGRAVLQAEKVEKAAPMWGINLSSGGHVDGPITKVRVAGFRETRCYREIIFEVTIDCDNSDSKVPNAPKSFERKFKVQRLPNV